MTPDELLQDLRAGSLDAPHERDRERMALAVKEIERLRALVAGTENELHSVRNFVCERITHEIEAIEDSRPSESFDRALYAHMAEERLRAYRRVDRRLLAWEQRLITAKSTTNHGTETE